MLERSQAVVASSIAPLYLKGKVYVSKHVVEKVDRLKKHAKRTHQRSQFTWGSSVCNVDCLWFVSSCFDSRLLVEVRVGRA